MKTRWKKLAAIAATCVMASTTALGFAACGGGDKPIGPDDKSHNHIPDQWEGTYTYNTYTTVTPSNWNQLDYSDNNDTQIMNYINSPFFEYDYEFDEAKGGKFRADGSINKEAIVPGSFQVRYSAVSALEDVTATYAADWGYSEDEVEEGGYAWKLTLRNDLKWDDGTEIKAADFVYSMEQQLDPKFQLTRADEYYNNAVKIRNARNYYYQGQEGWFPATTAYNTYSETIDDKLVFSIGNSAENDEDYGGSVSYFRDAMGFPESYTAQMVATYLNTYYLKSSVESILALEGKTLKEIKDDSALKATWDELIGWWQTDPNEELHFFLSIYTFPAMEIGQVGILAPSTYEIVLILDQPLTFFKEDGKTLSYQAAYYFNGLPLVHKAKYEANKHEPQSGSDLWTTTYDTSLESTASWGPYKLTSFQAGRQFVLEKNDKWYGYSLPENAGQYQTTRIVTDVIETTESAWLAFLAGNVDGVGIDITHKDDYRNSDFAYFTPGDGAYFINVYSNLEVLKKSGRNNGILAITEFRKAMSLALDRAAYNQELYTSAQPLLGCMGPLYYYDVENGAAYRYTQQAKEGLLRAYGFSQNADGTWTDGKKSYSFDDAYDAMTGYNLSQARELVEVAYKELTDNAEKYGYDASQKITLKVGTSTDNESTRRNFNYFVKWFENLTKGTSLAGKIELTFDASFGDSWASSFRNGEYEFAAGTGFGGADFDPFYMIGASINMSSISYHKYWDVETETLTMTLPAGDYALAGTTQTLPIATWYNNLNGNTSEDLFTANWSAGRCPVEVRLEILAMLEECALTHYYALPCTNEYSASIHGAKWDYISYEYNTMMGYGGIQYLTYNYNDAEWTEFVSSWKGDLTKLYKAS